MLGLCNAVQVVTVWQHLFVPQPALLPVLACGRCRQDQTPKQEILVDAYDDADEKKVVASSS